MYCAWKRVYCLFLLLVINSRLSAWTWLYTAVPQGNKRVSKHEELWQWNKLAIKPFSQLIFSWNAFRPLQGHFTFSLQVRDSKTKVWYSWHKMAHWGKNTQCSLISKTHKGTKFIYVRLELPSDCLADSFRLRVQALRGAKIANIAQVVVNTIDLKAFTCELNNYGLSNLASVYVSSVPQKSQIVLKHPASNRLCSPTSISMVVDYFTKKNSTPQAVAQGAYDNGLQVYGSWPFNAAHAFELCHGNYTFHVERLNSFKALHNYLRQSLPVIVSVRGAIKGAALPSYKNGHLLVVVGYDKHTKKVWCHDPAFKTNAKTRVAYDLDNFIAAWQRSYRIAIVPQKRVGSLVISKQKEQAKRLPKPIASLLFSNKTKLF